MPGNIILPWSFAVLILALSSSALASVSSFAIMSGLAGRTCLALLLLFPLLPGEGLGLLLLPVKFPWVVVAPANGTCMCHNVHLAFGIFPLPWAATMQTLRVFVTPVVGRAHLPPDIIGQTFLCLAMASCVDRTNGEKHLKSVVLALLTSLEIWESLAALLPYFALLEDLPLLSFALLEVVCKGFVTIITVK
jgi:hypothetical protein